MSKHNVQFFIEDLSDFSFTRKVEITTWLNQVAKKEGKTLLAMSIIFCSDDYLLDINKRFLNHDYFTDIITFPLNDSEAIEADVFVSVHRVRENAQKLGSPFQQELNRVMVHGLLHLIGYADATDDEKNVMRSLEDKYLMAIEF